MKNKNRSSVIDVAKASEHPDVVEWGFSYGLFLSRFRLDKEHKHRSATCIVCVGVLVEDGSDKPVLSCLFTWSVASMNPNTISDTIPKAIPTASYFLILFTTFYYLFTKIITLTYCFVRFPGVPRSPGGVPGSPRSVLRRFREGSEKVREG